MREPNFSFPAQNRASVCITSALYDRRALDCTAVLPLINSLTHLVYLTSTSPRIREILTMDGGLERLVRILKTPPTVDRRSGWKWALAFQCVVNVGVRGSEQIRTRVVEAGMVPVIITVLDNFLKALEEVKQEKEREQQQRLAALQQQQQQQQLNATSESTDLDRNHLSVMHLGASRSTPTAGSPGPSFVVPSASTPLATSSFAHGSTSASLAPTPSNSDSTAATSMPIPNSPSAMPVTTPFSFFAHLDESNSSTTLDYRGPRPTTDNLLRTDNGIHNANRNLRVDNATHRIPINGAEATSPTHIPGPASPTARATIEVPSPLRTPTTPTISMMAPTTTVVPPSPLSRSPPSGSNTPIASRSAPTAGITTTTTTTTPAFAPTTTNAALDAILHKEEDILLSLQLLAYLSKYPQLRTTFHTAYPPHNVFQLVEKFTHRLHPPAIHYWAGVIMRNACRKDESRGGVRQCAYLACGRWERYPREFAKCRRCRKAKYCSKQCQSKAWSEGHRWWCVERPHSGAGGGSSGGDGVPSNLATGVNGGIATPTGDEHHHHHHHHHGDDGDVDMNMVNLGNARGAALMPLVPPVQVRAALMATGIADPMAGDLADNDSPTPVNDLATAAAAVAHLSHRASHHHHHHHRPRSIRAIGGAGRGSEVDTTSGMMDMDEEMVTAAANAVASVLSP